MPEPYAPIVLFVYNRLDHTKQTVEALKRNLLAEQSDLYIFSDAPKTPQDITAVNAVRQYLHTITGFKSVSPSLKETNCGLAQSIIHGVGTLLTQRESVIVLEDDIVTSPHFLTYMNNALETYKKSTEIVSISGFNVHTLHNHFPKSYAYDTFMHWRPMSWGWGTWAHQWFQIPWEESFYQNLLTQPRFLRNLQRGGKDLSSMLKAQVEGKSDSWYIRFCSYAAEHNLKTIYPVHSFVRNIGFDQTGVHCGSDKRGNFSSNDLNDAIGPYAFSPQGLLQKQQLLHFNKAFETPFHKHLSRSLRKTVRRLRRRGHTLLHRKDDDQ